MLKDIIIIFIICEIFIISAIFSSSSQAGNISLKGQLSGWLTFNDRSLDDTEIGLRYMPEITVIKPLENDEKHELPFYLQ